MRIDHLREEDMASEDLGSPKKKHCVVWDEDNLITNEVIKSELNCEKIDEPDTPFVRSPLRSEDDSDEEQGRFPPLSGLARSKHIRVLEAISSFSFDIAHSWRLI
jgi:hypothetical protein